MATAIYRVKKTDSRMRYPSSHQTITEYMVAVRYSEVETPLDKLMKVFPNWKSQKDDHNPYELYETLYTFEPVEGDVVILGQISQKVIT